MSFKLITKGVWVGIFVLAGCGVGVWVGYHKAPAIDQVRGLDNKENELANKVDFSPFWKTLNILNEKYVPSNISSTTPESSNLINQQFVWGAISGLAEAVKDPYTIFLPPRENDIFRDDISGKFEGVGMEIALRNDMLIVIAPLKHSPAEKAGILSGDQIIEINGLTTTNLPLDQAVTRIRGEKGTKVKFEIIRKDKPEPLSISVVRDVINVPTIETELKNTATGKVFVISLYSFTATSPGLFRNALQKFSQSGTNKLIIDLRGNPGGYLEAAVDMASWFLPEGKPIVREYFGSKKPEEVYRSRGYDIFNESLKLVLLIDGGSASASEILAGALSEYNKAKLVGTKTFGKGSVQELIDITDKASLKVTVARWFTPNGHSISETGLTPDFVIEPTKQDIEKRNDVQMQKAIEIINKM